VRRRGPGADRHAKHPIENGYVRMTPSPMHSLGRVTPPSRTRQ
jgi:hypothetical protein